MIKTPRTVVAILHRLLRSSTSPISSAGYEFMRIKQIFRRSPLSADIGCGSMSRMSRQINKENVMNRQTWQTAAFLGVLAISMFCSVVLAQQSATASSPRLVNFTGNVADAQGKPPDANCSYTFTSGSNNTYLGYCVTVNGNILEIQTPFGQNMLGPNGEGYGICNESPAQNYDDYAVSDSGNWGNAAVLSHNSKSVKIARTTADGTWTLTQTITLVPSAVSIKVVMALKNNQSADNVAYLVRFADAEFPATTFAFWAGGLNSAYARTYQSDPNYGLQLSNVGIPQFSYWQGFAQNVGTGPNACAFAFNEGVDNFYSQGPGSIEMVYAGTVAAGQTKTVTLTYHGL
jgi:hypothetical protein